MRGCWSLLVYLLIWGTPLDWSVFVDLFYPRGGYRLGLVTSLASIPEEC